jgi:hypothetical protein
LVCRTLSGYRNEVISPLPLASNPSTTTQREICTVQLFFSKKLKEMNKNLKISRKIKYGEARWNLPLTHQRGGYLSRGRSSAGAN